VRGSAAQSEWLGGGNHKQLAIGGFCPRLSKNYSCKTQALDTETRTDDLSVSHRTLTRVLCGP